MRRTTAVWVMMAVIGAACGPSDDAEVTVPTSTTSAIERPSSTVATTTIARAGDGILVDGVTVTDDTIYLGMLTDLTGPFSGQVVDVIDAQLAFWDQVNGAGGIAGRKVELLISNTGYDVDTHVAKYAELRDKVVLFAHSTGSPHTVAIAAQLVADQRVAIPLTWYSGWADAQLGVNILETGSNYCLEAMNTLSYIAAVHQARTGVLPRIAVVSVPGDYGQDSAAGAKYAAAQLGLDVVYDGEAALVPGQDPTPVIAGIAASQPDWTWITTDPISVATVMAGALQAGYQGGWSGSSPTWNTRLLDTALGDYISQAVLVPVLFAPTGMDVDGMDQVMETLAAAYPDRYPADALIEGYVEFTVAKKVLEKAAELGDLTPAGVVAASKAIGTVSFGGVSPPNIYGGDANLSASRATGIVKPSKQKFVDQGGLAARLGDGATAPFDLVQGFFVSDLVASYDLQRPCYVLGG